MEQVNRVTIPCLFLVGLHCEPVVDFSSLHPFDFDRNLFNLLNIMNGDLLLADRGFNIHEAAGLFCAEVKLQWFYYTSYNLKASTVERKLCSS